jgi:hypothetical protein
LKQRNYATTKSRETKQKTTQQKLEDVLLFQKYEVDSQRMNEMRNKLTIFLKLGVVCWSVLFSLTGVALRCIA